jgi:hypothetical protein
MRYAGYPVIDICFLRVSDLIIQIHLLPAYRAVDPEGNVLSRKSIKSMIPDNPLKSQPFILKYIDIIRLASLYQAGNRIKIKKVPDIGICNFIVDVPDSEWLLQMNIIEYVGFPFDRLYGICHPAVKISFGTNKILQLFRAFLRCIFIIDNRFFTDVPEPCMGPFLLFEV